MSASVSGSAGQYITFQPLGYAGPGTGAAVVLDYSSLGTVADGVPFLKIDGQSFLRVVGLTFQNLACVGAMQRGVLITGSSQHIEIAGNRFLHHKNVGPHDAGNALLHFWIEPPASDVVIEGNELGDIQTNHGQVLAVAANHATIENNWIHDTDTTGCVFTFGASGHVFRRNLLEWVGKKRDGTLWYGSGSIVVHVEGGDDIIIERNTVRDSAVAFQVSSPPGYPASHDIVLRGNLAYRNQVGVVAGNWHSDTDGSRIYDVKVLNNTLYANASGMVIRPYVSATVVWEDNIVASSPAPLVNGLGWPVGTMDYNLYFGGGAPGTDAHGIVADPQFTDLGVNPPDLTLRATSPAANAGDPAYAPAVGETDFAGGPRVKSGRVDVGAFESN